MQENKKHEKYEHDDVNCIDHSNAAHEVDQALKTCHVPHHQPGKKGDGCRDEHHELVCQFLHGIEFIVRVHVMWPFFSHENPKAVILRLVKIAFEKIARVEVRVIIGDLV